jgi:hypothetical protein
VSTAASAKSATATAAGCLSLCHGGGSCTLVVDRHIPRSPGGRRALWSPPTRSDPPCRKGAFRVQPTGQCRGGVPMC